MRGLCSFPSQVSASPQVNRGCKLVGCGSAVPKLQMSNDDLSKDIETSDEWIEAQMGIQRRHVFSEKEGLTALTMGAAKNALQMAQVDPDDIDAILLFTATAEDLFRSSPQVLLAQAAQVTASIQHTYESHMIGSCSSSLLLCKINGLDPSKLHFLEYN